MNLATVVGFICSLLIGLHLKFTGTCINNTSVMMFKKGSFDIGATVYPVAIKVPLFVLVFFLML